MATHQEARAKVSDEVLSHFTTVRPMPDLFAAAKARAAELAVDGLKVHETAPSCSASHT